MRKLEPVQHGEWKSRVFWCNSSSLQCPSFPKDEERVGELKEGSY